MERLLWLLLVQEKNVYSEKPASWTVPETYLIRQTIKDTGVVYQLGRKVVRQTAIRKQREIIENGLLGPLNLIEVLPTVNDPNGAWVYDLIEGASPKTMIGVSSSAILNVSKNIWII